MLAGMRLLTFSPVALLALFACGDDGGSAPIDSAPGDDSQSGSDGGPAIDAAPTTFTLTSPTITNGGVIPLTHVCTNQGGQDLSPELVWINPPAGTMSFAVIFTDINSTTNPFIHSVIYDIPMSRTGLPADVDKVYAPPDVPDAHQVASFNGVRGYAGPCPGEMHTYEFALYALPTATLVGATMATNRPQAVTLITGNNLGVAKLTGTHTPP
jgi:Raf kinase inhibitor-like YbhB/YbcL family protein